MNESRPGLPAQNEHFGPIGGSDYCALVSSAKRAEASSQGPGLAGW